MSDPIDYTNYANQNRLNMANSLFGSGANSKIAGIPGDVLQQWNSLGANSKALKAIQEAENNGGVMPKADNDIELMSDRLFNDYYDPSTKQLKKATYTPDPANNPTVDNSASPADNLDSMRRLALAAIGKSDSLNSFHHNMFDKLRQKIADNLVTSGSGTKPVVTGDAEVAKISKSVGDFQLLVDDQTFTVTGNTGEKTYNFRIGDSLESIAGAINADTGETGVKAEVSKGDDGNYVITMTSENTGADSFVRVTQGAVGDMFGAQGSVLGANGKDVATTDAEVVDSGETSTAAVGAGLYTGKTMEKVAFTLSGSLGSKDYSFDHGTSAEDIVSAINADTGSTGVRAEVIRNSQGVSEGIGLVADKAGSNHFIHIVQQEGGLFAQPGKSLKVSGQNNGNESDGPGINSPSDLGKVTIDNVTYSFADLAPGGSATLSKNPDAALAVIDQALRDIYEGRAVVEGFDPAENPMPNMSTPSNTTASNTLEIGNYGSRAISDWVSALTKDFS